MHPKWKRITRQIETEGRPMGVQIWDGMGESKVRKHTQNGLIELPTSPLSEQTFKIFNTPGYTITDRYRETRRTTK